MAQRREHPYVWATWLPRLLTGENSCEWAVWFKAHHQDWTRTPSEFNQAEWMLNRTSLLNEQKTQWEARGQDVYVEGQNSFRLRGQSATLAGEVIYPTRTVRVPMGGLHTQSTHGRPAHAVHQGPRRLDPPDCRGQASRKGAQRTRVPFLRHHDQGLLRTRGQPSRTPRGNDSNFCEEATQSDPLWLDPKKVHLSTALERPVDSKGREIPRGTRTRPGAVLCGNSGCPATPTACTDINVTAGVRPVYHVKAINAAGAGPQSNYFLVEP